jgi:hypothetical protein
MASSSSSSSPNRETSNSSPSHTVFEDLAAGFVPLAQKVSQPLQRGLHEAQIIAGQTLTAEGRAQIREKVDAKLMQTRESLLQTPVSFTREHQLRQLEKDLGVSDGDVELPAHKQGRTSSDVDNTSINRPIVHGLNSNSISSIQGVSEQVNETINGVSHVSRNNSTRPSAATERQLAVERFERMSLQERIWVTMDDPSSSKAAQLIAAVVMVMIIISCVAFVVRTLPQYVEQEDSDGPNSSSSWSIIEDLCIIVFSVEFALRITTCPSKLKFIQEPLNIIDFVAILPFYVELIAGASSGGATVMRIIRLVRIFRVFKISRYIPWLRVFSNALILSLPPLTMLILVVMLAVVLFSSIMYYAERGEWDDERKKWIRTDPRTEESEVSPYQSIPDSFWWCIVTLTTVGYGDVTPISGIGRLIASIASLSGILVVAIPVSVISTNFNSEFQKLQRQREQVKSRMLLLKRHFRDGTTGLSAVLDEVDDIVKRNTAEFQSELEGLFDQARLELTEELQEVIKMAYEKRRQLHLAAIAAGQLHVDEAEIQTPVIETPRETNLSSTLSLKQEGGGGGGGGGEVISLSLQKTGIKDKDRVTSHRGQVFSSTEGDSSFTAELSALKTIS